MKIVDYVLVQWPDSQLLMEHERFNECLFVDNIEGHDDVGNSAYIYVSERSLSRNIYNVNRTI